MTDLEQIKQEARAAQGLLESPIFKKAVEDLNTRLTSSLMGASDQGRQLHLVAEIRALRDVVLQLRLYVSTGKFETKRKQNGRP